MEGIRACNNVGEKIDVILSDFTSIHVDGKRKIEEAIEILLSIKDNLEQEQKVNATNATTIQNGLSEVKERLSQLSSQHRSINKNLSKLDKQIELNFQQGCGMSIFEPLQSADAAKLMDQVICNHLLRNGFVESAVELSKESGLEIDSHMQQTSESLKEIQAKLKEKNLDAAIVWAQIHHQELLEMNSSLEFKLHQQKFIEILSQGPRSQNEALVYARNYFPLFSDRHETEIAKVMGVLAYVNRGQESPYKHFFDPIRWIEISELFNKAATRVLGFSTECPLSTCIDVGTKALPTLDDFQKSMAQINRQLNVSSENEMQIEVDTGGRVYHSVFNCPILRQQSSLSNPPVRLPCGHAISLEAVQKLRAYHNRGLGSGKCPYCPVIFENSRVTELHF